MINIFYLIDVLNKFNIDFYIIFLLFGIYFSIIGMKLLISNLFIMKRKSNIIKGKIIDFKEEYMKDHLKTYFAIIEYIDLETKELKSFTSNFGRATRSKLGEELDLYYYKSKKGKLRIEEKKFMLQTIGPLLFIIAGIFLIALFIFKPPIG